MVGRKATAVQSRLDYRGEGKLVGSYVSGMSCHGAAVAAVLLPNGWCRTS